MITTKIDKQEYDLRWPSLLECNSPESRYIILATGVGNTVNNLEGTIVHVFHTSEASVKVGVHSEAFVESRFTPYAGSVTLSNTLK